jgi:hypothetical protein
LCGGCALAILDGKIHQSGGHWSKLWFRRFFYVLFRGLLYLAMYLRANGDYTFSNLRPLDADQPSKQPPGWPEARHRLDDLIDAKDEALRDLRDQLEHMRRDSERKDAIIMQIAQANSTLAARVPELEAVSGQREAPETSSEEADKGIILQDQDEPQRRSWLHRLLIHT